MKRTKVTSKFDFEMAMGSGAWPASSSVRGDAGAAEGDAAAAIRRCRETELVKMESFSYCQQKDHTHALAL